MVDLDDKIHIQQVLDGETASFTHLVDKYKDMVFTVIYQILRQREDAEDAAQTVFIKAFKNLAGFQGDSKFSTWLYTIAYRTAIAKTKLKKFDTVDDTFHIDIATDHTFPQLEEMKKQEQKIYVKKAVDALPEIESAVVSLFYMDECSIQEIVAITKLTESNVKVKLHRARKALKASLEGLLQQEMKSII
ncbi:MAG: RNA polymerase sigma-70 factor (ECF subfamily) [Salibacteraceae bacterium]|jgi:RNA polymerase sigma-70 factor (ECF subfamily)